MDQSRADIRKSNRKSMVLPSPDPELADLERLVDWRLRRFKTHPEWSDIKQEGLIAAWRARVRCPDLTLSTVVCRAALWGAWEYLRSPRCRQPRYRDRKELPAPQFLFLEDMVRLPRAVSFDPLERLVGREIVAAALALLRGREREVVRRIFWEGQSYAEVGRALSCDHRNVHRLIEQGLNRYRKSVGGKENGAALNSRQRRRLREAEDGRTETPLLDR